MKNPCYADSHLTKHQEVSLVEDQHWTQLQEHSFLWWPEGNHSSLSMGCGQHGVLAWRPFFGDHWIFHPQGSSSTWKWFTSLSWFESVLTLELLSQLGTRRSHGKLWKAYLLSHSRTITWKVLSALIKWLIFLWPPTLNLQQSPVCNTGNQFSWLVSPKGLKLGTQLCLGLSRGVLEALFRVHHTGNVPKLLKTVEPGEWVERADPDVSRMDIRQPLRTVKIPAPGKMYWN